MILSFSNTHHFSKIYSGEDFRFPKPSKEAFRIVEKGDICIGNSYYKDLSIPKELGAITILISEDNIYQADYILKEIYEIFNIIEKIKSNQQQNLK